MENVRNVCHFSVRLSIFTESASCDKIVLSLLSSSFLVGSCSYCDRVMLWVAPPGVKTMPQSAGGSGGDGGRTDAAVEMGRAFYGHAGGNGKR